MWTFAVDLPTLILEIPLFRNWRRAKNRGTGMKRPGLTSELGYLRNYDPERYARPNVRVEVAVFTIFDGALHVLLRKRQSLPFLGAWSLAGGFVDMERDFNLEGAARRAVTEKCGLRPTYIEQLFTAGDAGRDPRYWTVSCLYMALSPDSVLPPPAANVAPLRWIRVQDGGIDGALAFDHAEILAKACGRLRERALTTSSPLFLLPEVFSLGDAQVVYEIVLGQRLDAKSFRRRMLSANVVEETGAFRDSGRRPAKLYRLVNRENPHLFLRAIEGVG
ncbi:MAG: NUDIX hydrolase [Alphaproteobacteria bacterium]|nr:NUDIX hydrolase [Alphaproteobacteria bacterium]